MKPNSLNRRQFIRTSVAVVGGGLLGPATLSSVTAATKRTAVDQVTLGHTGIRLSRLGMGTGSMGGRVQRDLGQEGLTRLVHYAYDQGITYFDTAQNYRIHGMLRQALRGLPREKLYLQTKMPGLPNRPMEVIDQYRKELDTDYLDSLLIHCAVKHSWQEDKKRLLDAFEEAKQKKWIRAHGVSCHGLPSLTRATEVDWVDVHLVRINHEGHHMDGATGKWSEPGNREAAMKEIRAMRAKGRGMIGMKLIGNGDFTTPEQREQSIQFVVRANVLDAMVIGFKSPAEIDEAIRRINRALAAG